MTLMYKYLLFMFGHLRSTQHMTQTFAAFCRQPQFAAGTDNSNS